MKGIPRSAVLLLLMLFLSACAANGKEASTDSSADARRFLRPGITFCSDGTTAYFLGNMLMGGEQLQFADLNSGVFGALCGRPECAHQDELCNAMLNSPVQGLSIYKDKLWWVSSQEYQPHIFCEELDGTARKDIRLLDNAAYTAISGNAMLCFWQDYLIACGNTLKVTDGQAKSGAVAVACSLSDPKQDLILMQETSEAEEYMAMRIQPFGDYLYGLCTSEQRLTLWRWRSGMDAVEVLYDAAAPCVVHSFWMREEEVLLSSADDGTVYSLDCSTWSFQPLLTLENAERVEFTDGLAVSMTRDEDQTLVLTTSPFDGTETKKIPLPGCEGAVAFCGADHRNLYIYCLNTESGEDCIIAASFADSSVRTIWEGVPGIGT